MQVKILQFWQWFTHNEAIFRNVLDPDRVTEMLNNQVLSFGKFGWGIDEGQAKGAFIFTFSPNNDKRLLSISKQLVQAAPNLPLWEFRYCNLPVKDWDFKFQMLNNLIVLETIDASEWQFVLIEEEDYQVSIEIKAENTERFDMDDKIALASRAVNNILGEELRIGEVKSIKVVYQFDPRDKDWIYPMKEFKKRFLYFIE